MGYHRAIKIKVMCMILLMDLAGIIETTTFPLNPSNAKKANRKIQTNKKL
jgi:hypothetical protein